MLAVELIRRLVAVAVALYQRAKSREQLKNLDSHLLNDVGLTPYDAMKEANKPFWR